jgi:hypothetical protein
VTEKVCVHYLTARFLALNFLAWWAEGVSLHLGLLWVWFTVVTPGFIASHPAGRLLLNLPCIVNMTCVLGRTESVVGMYYIHYGSKSCTNTDMLNWFCSNLGAVTLLALHTCCCHATSNVGDIWWGVESSGRSCESGFGEFQKTLIVQHISSYC